MITVTSSLPGGTAAAISDRLHELEIASGFPAYVQNLFDEGPHLVSTPETPWGDDARRLAMDAYLRFMYGENWIGGTGYRAMEREITAWLGARFGEPQAAGLMTAGGTESNLVALLAARQLGGGTGSVVLPSYSHYSHFKGCRLFNLEPVPVQPPSPLEVVDAKDIEAAIRPDTVAVVATAGTFGTGWIDPIDDIGRITAARNIPLHVDACCGGFILPFTSAGAGSPPVPRWDFTCPGVTSISADFHKHGLTPPPASAIIFRNPQDLTAAREVSPPHGGLLGTRAGGPVAAAWTMIQALGVEGYRATARCCLRIREELKTVIESLPDLRLVPGSHINFLAVYSDTKDLLAVWSQLRAKGWTLSYQTEPVTPLLVLWTLPQNHGCAERFRADLHEAVTQAPAKPAVTDSQPAWTVTPYGGVDD
jgi:glutamate/tyrosine decarboxylase-like PLP-dependent enzyme